MKSAAYEFGFAKGAGALEDIRQYMSRPVRRWGLRAALALASHSNPQISDQVAQQTKTLIRLGKLQEIERKRQLGNLMYRVLPTVETKLGAVPSDVKQQRRAVQALMGGHDFHGSGALDEIAQSGKLLPGKRSTFGEGVYYTQDRPSWEYWKDTFAHGPRQGGVIAPRSVTESKPARLFSDRPGAYRVGKEAPLSREITMVADASNPSALNALRRAQQQHHVRPMTLEALKDAYTQVHGKDVPFPFNPLYSSLVEELKSVPPISKGIGTLERAALAVRNLLGGRAL